MHGLTQSALLKALGWSLFNSLWQMSLLWACYHLFILIFRDVSARVRHGMAAVLLVSGAVWSLVTFVMTYWFGPATGTYLLPSAGPSFLALRPYGLRLNSLGQWFVGEGLSWCSFGYLIVLGGLIIHYANHYLRSRRIVKEGLSKIAADFRVFVTTAAHNMGIVPAVKVHLSSLVDVPVTLGFLKPIILLPVAMVTQLTTQQVEAILVHELAHIRRKDYLLNLGVTVIELLFFFNPFTRMLIRQLKKEREHCCDDLVLQFQYEPHAYVSALLSLARQHRHGRLAVAATGAGDDQLLLQRARKILQQKRGNERPGARPLFLLLLTTLAAVVILGPHRTSSPSQRVLMATARPAARTRFSYELDSRPIVNNISPDKKSKTSLPPATALVHRDAARRRAAPHSANAGNPADNEVSWYNVADAETAPDPSTAYADVVIVDKRDYSIGSSPSGDQTPAAPVSPGDGYPFVPQASFAFHYTDTLPPEQRLAMMQQFTERAIRVQMAQLAIGLKTRMNQLRETQTALANAYKTQTLTRDYQAASRQKLKLLLQDRLQLQHQYLIRMDSLERQLQRAVRRLTTVYI